LSSLFHIRTLASVALRGCRGKLTISVRCIVSESKTHEGRLSSQVACVSNTTSVVISALSISKIR
jgi:hypothetical protein